jgi:hypothetical protein
MTDPVNTARLRVVECVHWQHSELIMDAANELDALRVELSRLREALTKLCPCGCGQRNSFT